MREGRHGKLQHERASFVYIPEAGEPASAAVVNVAGVLKIDARLRFSSPSLQLRG
jgi:hypothetical protein